MTSSAGSLPVPGANKWFPFCGDLAPPGFRLFCFPFAGGNANLFREWGASLPGHVSVCAAQLPGRGGRFGELPFIRLDALIDALVPAIEPKLDRPFAFFGHSLGALVAFELTRRLRRERLPLPGHLFASAFRGPSLPASSPPGHSLPDEQFIQRLRELNGTPPEVLANAELLDVVLPLLRADFALVETYQYRTEEPLPCPISAWGGNDDVGGGGRALDAWGSETRATFRRRTFPGGHFFILHQQQRMLEGLREEIGF